MSDMHPDHPFDLNSTDEELELFAEEVGESQRHELPPNSLSTLGCDCGLSTFFCYGCGLVTARANEAVNARKSVDEEMGDIDSSFNWLQQKLTAPVENDRVAEVVQSLFRNRRG